MGSRGTVSAGICDDSCCAAHVEAAHVECRAELGCAHTRAAAVTLGSEQGVLEDASRSFGIGAWVVEQLHSLATEVKSGGQQVHCSHAGGDCVIGTVHVGAVRIGGAL